MRKVMILDVSATHARCVSTAGRHTTIRLDRFRSNASGYRLVSDFSSGLTTDSRTAMV